MTLLAFIKAGKLVTLYPKIARLTDQLYELHPLSYQLSFPRYIKDQCR